MSGKQCQSKQQHLLSSVSLYTVSLQTCTCTCNRPQSVEGAAAHAPSVNTAKTCQSGETCMFTCIQEGQDGASTSWSYRLAGYSSSCLSPMAAGHLDSPEVVPPAVTIAIPLWIIIASLLRRGESDKGGPRGGGQPDQRYGLEAVVVPSTARLQRAHHRLFSLWHASC